MINGLLLLPDPNVPVVQQDVGVGLHVQQGVQITQIVEPVKQVLNAITEATEPFLEPQMPKMYIYGLCLKNEI